jgi:hypothetical protein
MLAALQHLSFENWCYHFVVYGLESKELKVGRSSSTGLSFIKVALGISSRAERMR